MFSAMKPAISSFLLCCVIVCTTLFCGCSSESAEDSAVTSVTEEPLDAHKKEDAPQPIVRPPNQGVYFVRDLSGEHVRLEAGKKMDLQVTNADRGFGFIQPVGTVISDPANVWTVWSRTMNLRNVQITRYDGTVILSENWIDEPANTNIAWLPSLTLPALKNDRELEDSIIQLQLEKNLRPGFYVLHDDSFLRARLKDEVTAYYPFIIANDGNKEQVWLNAADACFKRIFTQYENAYQSGVQSNYKVLRGCAERQHLALKLTKQNDVKQRLKKQLLFLSSLANPSMTEVKNMLYEQMAPKGDNLTVWFWKKTHADAVDRLSKVASCLRRGVAYEDLLPGLYSYYLGTLMPPVYDLEAFVWIPFTYLDPKSDLLKRLFNLIVDRNDDWKILLVQILEAIELDRINKSSRSNAALKEWAESMTQDNLRAFSELSEELKLLDKTQTIAVGPFTFRNLSEEEQAEVEQKARSHESQLNSCYRNYERRVGKRASSFILEVPLDNQISGRPLMAVMKDPFEEHRRLPAVDSEFIQCVRHVYSDLALRPTLNPEKSVSFMVSISAQKISPWLK